jgi:hypothetical protein
LISGATFVRKKHLIDIKFILKYICDMINFKFQKIAIFFSLIAIVSTSCIDSDTDPYGFGDAFILIEIMGQDTLAGLGLHAYSYSEFTAVNVHHNNNEESFYALTPFMGFNQDFVWNTPRDQYQKELPPEGDYVFNATFRNGQTQTFSNKLFSSVVYPPLITRCVYVPSTQRIEIDWERSTNADSYNVRLLNENGDILFVSPILNRITEEYTFTRTTQGWQTSSLPTTGQTVVVELSAYLLEPNSTNNQLQCIARSRQSVTWGG